MTPHPAVDFEKVDAGDGDDARTLHVDYDEEGVRYKSWRRTCIGGHDIMLTGCKPPGPPVCTKMCDFKEQHRGSPTKWFLEWCHDLSNGKQDRVCHRVSVLVKALYRADICDKVKLGGLACP